MNKFFGGVFLLFGLLIILIVSAHIVFIEFDASPKKIFSTVVAIIYAILSIGRGTYLLSKKSREV